MGLLTELIANIIEMDWGVESIYVFAQIIFCYRVVYHAKVSKEANRSITPMFYWTLNIFGNLIIGIYGIFKGSFAMPLFAIIGIPFSLYHMKIENDRVKNQKEDPRVKYYKQIKGIHNE